MSWKGANTELTTSGSFTATNATITGALTAGSGSSIDGAYITSLSADKITSGTLDCGSITVTNLSAGSITTGEMDFSHITQSSVDIIESMIHSDAVTNAKIAANAVRTSELYIDGDVNFAANGTRHALYGVTDLYASTSKSTAQAYIQINAGNIQLYESSSGSRLQVDNDIQIVATSDINLMATDHVTGTFEYDYTVVYGTAAAKTSWTDLDLSGTVGSGRAIVLLEIYNSSPSNINYRFRTNGSSHEQNYAVDNYPGAFSTRVDSTSDYNYVWCLTDAYGKIEWKADVAGNTQIRLLAHFN